MVVDAGAGAARRRGPIPHRLEVQAGEPTDAPWVHVPSRMRFLQRHLEWTAQATFRYDENARDISVRYGGPSGALVSVYLSPLGGPQSFRNYYYASVRETLRALGATEFADEDVCFGYDSGTAIRGRRVCVVEPRSSVSRPRNYLELYPCGGWVLKLRVTVGDARTEGDFIDHWLMSCQLGT